MRNLIALLFLFATARAAVAADGPVERWASAVGGRDKVAAVKSLYREGGFVRRERHRDGAIAFFVRYCLGKRPVSPLGP